MGNAEKSKIAVISPYLNILGGGERYILTIAEFLLNQYDVDIFWNDRTLIEDSKKKLHIDLSKAKFNKVPQNSLSLIKSLLPFKRLFYMTDGSLFMSPCSNNYLIIQSPLHIPANNIGNKIKLMRFKYILCYSDFMKNIIKKRLGIDAKVISPPVLTKEFKPAPKENMIISVGRFFPWLHSKKQEVLVDAFRKLYSFKEFKNWKLVLIGSVDKGGDEYYRNVVKKALNLPVEIITDASFRRLTEFIGKAKIYWHATGFGEDLDKFPEKAEHFGITTVEAMAGGCVPVVYNGGGQKEIVRNGENGFLWTSINDLINRTREIVSDQSTLQLFSQKAVKDSKKYSKENFISLVKNLMVNK